MPARTQARTNACRLLAVLAACLLAIPAATQAAADTAIGRSSPGQAQAYSVTSRATERVNMLSVYIDSGSRLTASSRLELGLYANRAGAPHRRLGRCVASRLVKKAWNRCTFSAVRVRRGAAYWVVVLQPRGSAGSVRYRNESSRGGTLAAVNVSRRASLAALPARWAAGRKRRGPVPAIYGSVTGPVTEATPTPTSAALPAPATPALPAPAPAPLPTPTPVLVPAPQPSASCDLLVGDRAALLAAVRNTSNGGRTVCARAGDYGTGELTVSVRHTTKLTLRAAPGDQVMLPGVVLAGVTNLRVEGFDMPRGGFDTAQQSARNIELVGNEIHDCACQALRMWGGDQNILFERNHVHDIRHNGAWHTGWGVNATGGNGGTSGLRIRYNTFDRLGNDAMEIGDSDDGEIVGNVIKRVDADPAYPDPHPDSIMLWAGSERWLIKDNRITDGRGLLMSGSTTDVRMENNLIARMKNYCHDGGTTGSSTAGLVRYTWVRNTIYDCGSFWGGGGFGGGYGLLSDGPASGNVLERNLVTTVGYEAEQQFQSSDRNLVRNGSGPSSSDRTFTPQFADQVDYRPTNLPAGYDDVGYRAAPAGHTAG